MEPVEINAGSWYLRTLRADRRVDDRPALAELGESDPDYVDHRNTQWLDESYYTWAVCEPTTGELLAEVVLNTTTGEISSRARDGHTEAADTAAQAVRRFADAALGR